MASHPHRPREKGGSSHPPLCGVFLSRPRLAGGPTSRAEGPQRQRRWGSWVTGQGGARASPSLGHHEELELPPPMVVRTVRRSVDL
ncbi:hypothetical protein Scep_011532 [Stephania cephalantha]|uniref:Uncharacterized protein n=1 Tax=Stephania cephalantha TaxID=152367 RepID=A0AAP0JDJ2_9MAGN